MKSCEAGVTEAMHPPALLCWQARHWDETQQEAVCTDGGNYEWESAFNMHEE